MKYLFTTLIVLGAFFANAQKYKSASSYVRFFSDAPMEDIEAVNEKSTSLIDLESKAIVFVVPIVSFQFQKSLMQEHFNENYLESEKYPKAVFKGKIESWNESDGKNKAIAKGELELHGVKRQVSFEGTIDKANNKLIVESIFTIKLEDYKIKIPKAVFYKIAEEVEVTLKFEYNPYETN